MSGSVESIGLLGDGLALIYHEARNVRYLIKADYIKSKGWERLMSLPKNRRAAWKEIQSLRQGACEKGTARQAARVFEQRFGKSVDDLERLYWDPHWKHAATLGGHAWHTVTMVVATLASAIDQGDPVATAMACQALLRARHNNGELREKITDLDLHAGVLTDDRWQESAASTS